MNQKVIGVLTSGGDAPGMNAAVRGVVRSAIKRGMRVVGIRRGYNGLIHGDVFEMNMRDVSDIISAAALSCIQPAVWSLRSRPRAESQRDLREAGYQRRGGRRGDGSFRGASDLSKAGVPCIGLPGTIDNDISCTDYTIGYDTAMNTVCEMVDKLRDTAQSHDRCSVWK